METDSITTDDENEAKCAKLIDLRDFQLLHEARLRQHREIQQMILSGEMRGNKLAYENLIKEIEKTSTSLDEVAGELTLIGTCPKTDCQFHPKANVQNDPKIKLNATNQLENQLAKLNVSKNNNDKIKNSDRSDGFTTPSKAAKKQKVLQNYSVGANP
ncbi:hypothetical protein TNIN_340271 [Trichonephila inaurata madagascariensis]|uniref:Uncharacterized protein n=1 Tax=Trichonephila inaurata madagascariensis TaxID=2747483 RepID=A0A8X6X3H2_9ARAC|nr:hypothetical protein TNIN_340271 [Trichonephila inaurata madagascariensis]